MRKTSTDHTHPFNIPMTAWDPRTRTFECLSKYSTIMGDRNSHEFEQPTVVAPMLNCDQRRPFLPTHTSVGFECLFQQVFRKHLWHSDEG